MENCLLLLKQALNVPGASGGLYENELSFLLGKKALLVSDAKSKFIDGDVKKGLTKSAKEEARISHIAENEYTNIMAPLAGKSGDNKYVIKAALCRYSEAISEQDKHTAADIAAANYSASDPEHSLIKLLSMNSVASADPSKRKVTTFFYALVHNNRSDKEIFSFICDLNNAAMINPALVLNYMNLHNEEGSSILKTLKERPRSGEYLGIYERIIGDFPELFPEEAAIKIMQTYMGSVSKSANKSAVQLAKDFDERHFEGIFVNHDIDMKVATVTRNNSWWEKINVKAEELKGKLILLEQDDEFLNDFLSTIWKDEDEDQKDKIKEDFRLLCQIALRLISDINASTNYAQILQTSPNDSFLLERAHVYLKPLPCGLNSKEVVAIFYDSISNRELWGHPDEYNQHFMSFITGLCEVKKISINQPEGLRRADAGLLSSITLRLKDHKHIGSNFDNPSKTLDKLPKTLKYLTEEDPHIKSLVQTWMDSGIIPEELKNLLLSHEGSESSIIEQALRNVDTKRTREILKASGKILPKEVENIEYGVNSFVRSKTHGYIPYLEFLFEINKELFFTLLNKELTNFASESDKARSEQSASLIELLLNSPNKDLVSECKKILLETLGKIPKERLNFKLLLATENSYSQLLLNLIEAGGDVNIVDTRGDERNTLLHIAAKRHFSLNAPPNSPISRITELLLQKVSQQTINAVNASGKTALRNAIDRGSIKIAELLLEKMDSDAINSADTDKVTCLHSAVMKCTSETLIETLLKKMSKSAIALESNELGSALTRVICYVYNPKLIELLLKHMDVEGINSTYSSRPEMFHSSIYLEDNAEFLKILVEKMDPKIANKDGGFYEKLLDFAYERGLEDLANMVREKRGTLPVTEITGEFDASTDNPDKGARI